MKASLSLTMLKSAVEVMDWTKNAVAMIYFGVGGDI
jgi:hypothetical protein